MFRNAKQESAEVEGDRGAWLSGGQWRAVVRGSFGESQWPVQRSYPADQRPLRGS